MGNTARPCPETPGTEVAAPRPVSLTHLPDGRAILEVGDARIDFSEREIEVLTWMLVPKTNIAPAGATTQEHLMPKIKAGAVARQVSPQFGQADLGIAVREVAREAARQWGSEHATTFTDSPEQFGKKVAEVYLAAATDLSAGFEPCAECPGAHS